MVRSNDDIITELSDHVEPTNLMEKVDNYLTHWTLDNLDSTISVIITLQCNTQL